MASWKGCGTEGEGSRQRAVSGVGRERTAGPGGGRKVIV